MHHVTLKRLERYDTMRGARSMPVSDIMRLVAGCLHQAHHAQSFVQCLPGHSQQVLTNLRQWQPLVQTALEHSNSCRRQTTRATLSKEASADVDSITGAGIIKAQVQWRVLMTVCSRDST